MIITKEWAMPNKDTFKIKPIKEFIERQIFRDAVIVEPFVGNSQFGNITNDINPDKFAQYHMDALAFLNILPDNSADIILYDPPYSLHQAIEIYQSYGADKLAISVGNMKYWRECKDRISKIVKPDGKCICFGWNTNGLGIKRGFRMDEILIVSHGGSRNDTLVTLETRISSGDVDYSLNDKVSRGRRLF